MTALGAGIVFKGEKPECPLEYLIEHCSLYFPLIIQPLLGNIVVPDRNQQDSNHYNGVRRRQLADLRRQIANCDIYTLLYQFASNI